MVREDGRPSAASGNATVTGTRWPDATTDGATTVTPRKFLRSYA
jgi:hypothetical protein